MAVGAMAVELGQGGGGCRHAGRARLTYAFEVPEVFGTGKVRELAAECEDLLVRLGPVQGGPAIGTEQRVIPRGLVSRRRLLGLVWRLRVLRVLRLLGILELLRGVLL
jgi:hypothetical protein